MQCSACFDVYRKCMMPFLNACINSDCNFFVFFSPNVEGVSDMSMRSGYIRDHTRKLSEIAPNFGRFFALPIFWGSFESYAAFITPASRRAARRLEKVFVRYSH